jgi:acetolactate decarboxylase
MGLDAGLAAAVTLQRQHDLDPTCPMADGVTQLALAHVLLDGGYDGVATLAELLPAGDHGLGAADKLDGEVVVVDGTPWRVPHTGLAQVMPPSSAVPFLVLTTMESPATVRLRDASRDDVVAAIGALAGRPDVIVAARLEGTFSDVLLRSVPGQTPPYRPIADVLAADEVRWRHPTFEGVFVGFSFPDFGAGAVIPGLHLHGLDTGRTTGGHNHELHVVDAELRVSTTRSVGIALPDRSMVELLSMPDPLRAVQRALLRRGALTTAGLANALGISAADALERLSWLADRGFVAEHAGGLAGLGGEPRWHVTMRGPSRKLPRRVDELLADL